MSQDFMTDQEKILRKLLAERILFMDGAMGTMIQQHKLTEEDYRGGSDGRFAKFSAPKVLVSIMSEPASK